MALGTAPRSTMTRSSMSVGGGTSRPSMGALSNYGGATGAAAAPARRPAAMTGAPVRPGYSGGANPWGGAVGGQQPTGRQYNRTDRSALPMGPHIRESYGVDPYGNEYVASSEEHPGYVDPNLRFRLEHEARSREGEGRDRLAEIRETGNQGRLTSGQEQQWTTGERVRGRGEYLEDDRRMFERLPGLWEMITGEGGGSGGADARPSMAALTGRGAAAADAGGGLSRSAVEPVEGNGLARQAVEPRTAGDATANEAADLAFARAKDKAGLLAGARMKGARAALADSSLGTQARATSGILGDAASGLSDVATAQAIQQAQRAADVEDRNYAGGLTRRGQNMGIAPSILALLRGQGRAY